MLPADSPNSILSEKDLWYPLATAWLCPASPFPLERFEMLSLLKFAIFYPSAVVLWAVLYRLTPRSWCCDYVWCEFSIRSMTTKKGLQKRRHTILSCGMLEVQWVVPLVWKAQEQYFITHWMVSLLGINLFLSLVSVESSLGSGAGLL